MKKYLCLTLAILLCVAALTGCQKDAEAGSISPAPEGSSSPAPEGDPGGAASDGSPAGEPKERWEGPIPGDTFPLLEFHAGEDGRPDDCAVELPLLKNWPMEGWEDPDLAPANEPLEQLRREWEAFRESPEHDNGGWWEVRSYPYSNGDWVQVVVHKAAYPTYADNGSILSANFDRRTGRVVTAGEAMERFAVTPEGLQDKLNAQDLADLVQLPGARVTAQRVEVTAFRGRGDGTAVFFARVRFEVAGNEDYNGLVAYDTRDGSFAPFREKLDRGEEPPNGIRYHYGSEVFPGTRPEYPLERAAAPAAEVRVVMPLREYHDLNCFAEIPRLVGTEGLEQVNVPFEQLEREWKEYRASPDHEAPIDEIYSQSMAVQSYPYSDSRWAQVVVTGCRRADSGSDFSTQVLSANYDLEQRRVVTADEMLEQKGLTADWLLERLKQEDIYTILQVHSTHQYTPKAVAVRGFRGREDGSAVFYLAVDCHYRCVYYEGETPVGSEEYDTVCLLAYDTGDDTFRDITRDLLRKWEDVELPNSFDPPLRWEEDVQNPMA